MYGLSWSMSKSRSLGKGRESDLRDTVKPLMHDVTTQSGAFVELLLDPERFRGVFSWIFVGDAEDCNTHRH